MWRASLRRRQLFRRSLLDFRCPASSATHSVTRIRPSYPYHTSRFSLNTSLNGTELSRVLDREEEDDEEEVPFANEVVADDDRDDADENSSLEPLVQFDTDPLCNINNYFQTKYMLRRSRSLDMKVSSRSLPNGRLVWRAEYHCPQTDRVYYSGTRTNIESEKLGGFVYYPKKDQALHAAAARAMDVIQYHETGLRNPRWCEEDPAIKDEDLFVDDGESDPPLVRGSRLVDAAPQSSPLQVLNQHYRNRHRIQKSCTNHMTFTEEEFDNQLYWTGEFVCPVSGQTFRPIAIPERAHVVDDDRMVYYRKKIDTIQAIAATAVEDLVEDDEKEMTSKSRPRRSAKSIEFTPEQPTKLDKLLDNEELNRKEDCSGELGESVDEEPAEVKEDEDEDDDLVAAVAPASDCRVPPSIRILSSLVHKGGYNVVATNWGPEHALPPATRSPGKVLSDLVTRALSWVSSLTEGPTNRTRKSIHRVVLPKQDSGLTLLMGESILSGLAQALLKTPVTVGLRAGRAAPKILNTLWYSSDTSCRPTTETYNLFLSCLSGGDPRAVAMRIENIVKSMERKEAWKGHTLPSPNQRTYNILLQKWAQVGGEEGRYWSNFDETPPGFEPDRESFLHLLSSNTYVGTEKEFDADFAKVCIERMRALAAERGDESLRPDVVVYNAALPWCGGSEWFSSRPYARYIGWDIPQPVGNSGARSTAWNNAIAIDAWVREMEESTDVTPNLESYEAMLQAWLRTGDSEGLDHADKVALELVSKYRDGQIELRLQTFRPLVAAWMFLAPDEDSAKRYFEKARQWVSLLSELSQNPGSHHLHPDERMLEALVRSNASFLDDDECFELLSTIVKAADEEYGTPFDYAPFCFALRREGVTHADTYANADRILDLFESSVQKVLREEMDLDLLGPEAGSDRLLYLLAGAINVYSAYVDVTHASLRSDDDKMKIIGADEAAIKFERVMRRVAELADIIDHQTSLRNRSHKTLDGVKTDTASNDWLQLRSVRFHYDLFEYPRDTTSTLPHGVRDRLSAFLSLSLSYVRALKEMDAQRGDILRVGGLMYEIAAQHGVHGLLSQVDELLRQDGGTELLRHGTGGEPTARVVPDEEMKKKLDRIEDERRSSRRKRAAARRKERRAERKAARRKRKSK